MWWDGWFMTCWSVILSKMMNWWTSRIQQCNCSKIIQHNHTGKATLSCKYLSSAYAVSIAWLPESIIFIFFQIFTTEKLVFFQIMTIEKTRSNTTYHSFFTREARRDSQTGSRIIEPTAMKKQRIEETKKPPGRQACNWQTDNIQHAMSLHSHQPMITENHQTTPRHWSHSSHHSAARQLATSVHPTNQPNNQTTKQPTGWWVTNLRNELS